ncbi:YHS domain-containing protein [bacterium]|nr:YHS domain-containing protein [bacterium]
MKKIFAALITVFAAVLLFGCAKKNEPLKNNVQETAQLPEVVVCSIDSTGSVLLVHDDSIPVFKYKGKEYYFSSKACRDIVVADPDKYLGP